MYSFINTYKMPLDICDKVIDYYEKNNQKVEAGKLGAKEESRVDKDLKDSFDLSITKEQTYELSDYFLRLKKMISEYIEDIKSQHNLDADFGPYTLSNAVNIQKYPKGGGFKFLHFERGHGFKDREFVFMTYLTDTPNAGTNFPYQNITTECVKGDTIIWPAGFTHPHVGIISNEHEKMIITGWINYEEFEV